MDARGQSNWVSCLQKSGKTTEDDLVLPRRLFRPTKTRESTPADTNNSEYFEPTRGRLESRCAFNICLQILFLVPQPRFQYVCYGTRAPKRERLNRSTVYSERATSLQFMCAGCRPGVYTLSLPTDDFALFWLY